MNREEAIDLLKSYIKNPNMINHCLASEAVMRDLARHFGEDEEKWALAGLLHDLDVEVINADPKEHGLKTAEILEEKGLDGGIIDAIKHHNEEATGKERSGRFQHALAAGETITGLIVATTLVYPDKKVASVKPKSIRKRMKEKSFAASVKRENIMECEKAGIPLDEFIVLSLGAMSRIGDDIGL
ncbi:MAG: HDIG domain-containing protein [Bacteroidales bacterium]|nr:HDIG domain-containing protein [Bacteroidales bacterium]MCF8343785.1 HDIG domain-containing protein [Bacteroidales bacterium]MCF8350291.1 HDIG domain-containing protein [Bacteroidales bacterium]MCF8374730.1 HDIG domain-containing protein [Bacteroidales bacterium]MCF8399866.1 HDIG domain-containing protein [Bacteroidales bacterium]